MNVLPRYMSSALNLQNNAYVDCGNPQILQGLGSYTLEAWVNFSSVGGKQNVISKGDVGNGPEYMLYITNGTVVSANNWGSVQSQTILSPNVWYYLVTSYDSEAGLLTLYINCIQESQGTFAYSQYSSTASVIIGQGLQGSIGCVQIWNVCRDTDEVADDSVPDTVATDEANLIAYFDFTNLPVDDESGNNITVTYRNGANFCQYTPGLYLDGISSYADCSNSPGLSMGRQASYTIEGWFYPVGTSGVIISKFDESTGGEYRVTYSNGQVTAYRSGSSLGQISSNAAIVPYNYYHFATTYNSSNQTMNLYINGNHHSSVYCEIPMDSAPSLDVLIGAEYNNGAPCNFFEGYVQNVRIWNVALTLDEIRQWMYNQPVYDTRLAASFDFTGDKPVETNSGIGVTLAGAAVLSSVSIVYDPAGSEANLGFFDPINAMYVNDITANPMSCPNVDINIPDDGKVDIFSEEYKQTLLNGLKAAISSCPDDIKQLRLIQFEKAYSKAIEAFNVNPSLKKVFSEKVENGILTITHHGIKGDTVIFQGPEDALDDRTKWWIKFIYQLTVGFFQAIGLLPSLGDIATRIYNIVVRNAAAIAAITNLISYGAGISLSVALPIIQVLYDQGLLWSIMKLVLSSLGWFALLWVLRKILEFLLGVEAASMLAGFVVWAIQLAHLALEYPNEAGQLAVQA